MIPFIPHMDFIKYILLSPLFRWRKQGPILVGKYVTHHWRQDLLSVIGLTSSYKPLSLLLFLLFLSPSLPWWNTAFCISIIFNAFLYRIFFLSVLGYKSQKWNRQEPCTQVICRFILYLTTFHICNSVHFSRSVVSDSLRPHESQHARPPCPTPVPGVHWDSHPSSQWCHPAISSSVISFSSCLQSLPASESFPMSQLFAWGD